jgi:hypothetical protein
MFLEVRTIQVDSGKVCVTQVGIWEAALTSYLRSSSARFSEGV